MTSLREAYPRMELAVLPHALAQANQRMAGPISAHDLREMALAGLVLARRNYEGKATTELQIRPITHPEVLLVVRMLHAEMGRVATVVTVLYTEANFDLTRVTMRPFRSKRGQLPARRKK